MDQHGHFVVALCADQLQDVLDPHDIRVEEAFAVDNTVVNVSFSSEIEHDVHLVQVVHCGNVCFEEFE